MNFARVGTNGLNFVLNKFLVGLGMSVMPFVRAFGISGNVHENSNHRIDCVFLYDIILMLYKGIGAWTKSDESDSGNFP